MSIIKQKKQRVAIFIDAQNLYHSARNLYGTNVNFKNILEDTLAERELVRAIAYVITTESGEEKNFFEALQKAGIETKSKDLQIFAGGAKKGDWDVGMTVDAIRLAPSVDAVVLISGDGDFIPLVEYLKFNSGCQVEAATFKSSASAGLVEVVDDFFDLAEDPDRYLIRKYGRRSFAGYKRTNMYGHRSGEQELEKKETDTPEREQETPEMVAERIAGQRGNPQKKRTSNNRSSRVTRSETSSTLSAPVNMKATEVEIVRVKKENKVEGIEKKLKKVSKSVKSTVQKTTPKKEVKDKKVLVKRINDKNSPVKKSVSPKKLKPILKKKVASKSKSKVAPTKKEGNK